MEKSDKAVELFKGGLCCSQAVFCAFAEDFGMDAETARKVSAGLGGGVGRMREVCGTVTGASLVRVTSQPLAYTDGYAQICTFSGTREALFSWLLLLEIVKADYTLLGVYETLKE